MPISSIRQAWSTELWNPTYASHVNKVTVAIAIFGNIVWIWLLALGMSIDVLIWDGHVPSRTRGDFFDFEVGGHDRARCKSICLFFGRKNGTLTARQQSYIDVHACYKAQIELFFCSFVHFRSDHLLWYHLFMDHGNMFHLMFGRLVVQATHLPCKMMEGLGLRLWHYAAKSTPPHFVESTMKMIACGVLIHTLAGTKLFIRHTNRHVDFFQSQGFQLQVYVPASHQQSFIVLNNISNL